MYIICLSTQVAGVIYFFSPQFNNNSNKKKDKLMGSTRPMWVGLGCVRLM